MKKKLLVVLTSMFTLASVATVVAVSNSNNFEKGSATEKQDYSVTFNTSSARTKLTSQKYVFTEKTTEGTDLYLLSYGSGMKSSGPIASMKTDYTENDYSLKFVAGIDGEGTFSFQNIKSITINTSSTSVSGAGFSVITSVGGSASYTQASTAASTEYVINDIAGATYLKIVPTNTTWLDIASLKVDYSCGPISEVTLESLQLSGGQTQFYVNETFSFTGTARAIYSDASNKVVTSEVVVGSVDMTTAGDKVVDISYTEDDVTVHANFNFKVLPAGAKSITIEYLDLDDDYCPVPAEYIIDFDNSNIPEYSVAGNNVEIAITFMYDISVIAAFDEYDTEYSVSGTTITYTAPNVGLSSGYVISVLVRFN